MRLVSGRLTDRHAGGTWTCGWHAHRNTQIYTHTQTHTHTQPPADKPQKLPRYLRLSQINYLPGPRVEDTGSNTRRERSHETTSGTKINRLFTLF